MEYNTRRRERAARERLKKTEQEARDRIKEATDAAEERFEREREEWMRERESLMNDLARAKARNRQEKSRILASKRNRDPDAGPPASGGAD